jgi:hypothetical protein
MKNKHELKTIERDVGDEDMVYTNEELKALVINLVESHLTALNKLQTMEVKAHGIDNSLGFGSDPMLASL